MKTVELKLYEISELSEESKERAFNKWSENFYYHWHDDNVKVLEEFAKEFPVQINNYEYDQYYGSVNWDFMDDNTREISGIRLMAKLLNTYFDVIYTGKWYHVGYKDKERKPSYISKHSKVIFQESTLTGYCVGYDILLPIFEFLKNPINITFEDLMQECIDAWIDSCTSDYNYTCSMEAFIEDAEANEWEFMENGIMY